MATYELVNKIDATTSWSQSAASDFYEWECSSSQSQRERLSDDDESSTTPTTNCRRRLNSNLNESNNTVESRMSQSQGQFPEGQEDVVTVTKCWRTRPRRQLRLFPLTRTMSHLVSLIILSTLFLCSMCYSSKVYNVSWNSSNPIFRIDNTDHIIDVNRDNLPYDQVNIICPVYAPGTKEEDAEKYIIYNVSKEEYDSCRITNPNPRIIAVCDKPYRLLYFTITFRSFTPTPGGLEFRPGQDYYFISTSSRDDLHRRVGGRCSSENMKVVFKVCCHPGESTSQLTTTPAPPAASLVPRFTTLSTVLPTTKIARRPQIVYTSSSTTSATTYLPPIISTRYPLTKTQNKNNPNFKTTSKTKTLEKHPNEVVKNEELTSGGSIPGAWTTHSASFLLFLLAVRTPFWWLR